MSVTIDGAPQVETDDIDVPRRFITGHEVKTSVFNFQHEGNDALEESVVATEDRVLVGWKLCDAETPGSQFEVEQFVYYPGEPRDTNLDTPGAGAGESSQRDDARLIANAGISWGSPNGLATRNANETTFMPHDMYVPWREDETVIVRSEEFEGTALTMSALLYWQKGDIVEPSSARLPG